ncbi:MAG TPA: PLDc N-terminal domain-containing protein [Caulobacteraceae bacterium]|nr:PLDc N-terminal domain-containing protein [Caulobacteraceae bacterium]
MSAPSLHAVPPLIVVLIPLVAVAFDAMCLMDLARADVVRRFDKMTWAVLICLFTPFGGISYLYLGRE